MPKSAGRDGAPAAEVLGDEVVELRPVGRSKWRVFLQMAGRASSASSSPPPAGAMARRPRRRSPRRCRKRAPGAPPRRMRRQPAARGGGGRAAASAARAAARAAAGAAASGQVATAASERLDRARAPGAQASRALHHSLTSAPSQSQRRVHARRGDLVKRPDRRPYRGDHAQPARGRQSPRSRPSRSGAPLGNGGARRRVRVCRSPGAPSSLNE